MSMTNPFDVFKTHETASAIAQKEGEEAKFYPHGEDGKPLDEFKAAWWQWTRTGVFADPRDPKVLLNYPIKGANGLWYQFIKEVPAIQEGASAAILVMWTGGDPERYIAEHPIPRNVRPSLEQIMRLYTAAFPENQ